MTNMIVDFDPDGHLYTVDGEPVPSVTQLVAPLGADYDEPDDLMEGVLDAAAERGITMHDYLAFRLKGGERYDYELPDAYEAYADAVEDFIAEHEITPLLIETPMPGVGFAGTPDLVAEFDGKVTILDWKFVSQIDKTKVGAQLAGYSILCDVSGIPVDDLVAVQFLPGDYRLYPVESTEQAKEDFYLVQDVYDAKMRPHTRGKI